MCPPSSRALWTAKLLGKPVRGGAAHKKAEALVALRSAPRARFRGVVLGIDPSLRGTGLAVVSFRDDARGALLLSRRVTNKPKVTFYECLGEIFKAVTEALEAFPVETVALEETIYVQNFKTAQILGAARGAAIAAASLRALPVSEYAPLRVKQAVVGHGKASKEQVARMMGQMLRLTAPLSLDETDAVAVALCHAFSH